MLRVLIVDDDALMRRCCCRAVRPLDATVEAVSDIQSALAALAAQPFDVALVDLNLGSERGIDLLELIARRYPHMDRVLMTGEDAEDLPVGVVRVLAHRVLPKPFSPGELRAVLKPSRAAGGRTSAAPPAG
jgi:two-component system, NtrC family, response regulator AlgB